MGQVEFSREDIEQIEHQGLTEEQVRGQIALFEKGAPFAKLHRPATAGDGIRKFSGDEIEHYSRVYDETVRGRRLTKFVPASGAATRMFKSLLKVHGGGLRIERSVIADRAAGEGGEYGDVLRFMDHIDRFAFYDALKARMADAGLNLEELREKGDYTAAIDVLLSDHGLGYANRPKGQILFHRYLDGARIAFEEHLVEAAEYVRDDNGNCRLHFTVSPEHETGFRDLLEQTAPAHERSGAVRFEVSFSRQDPSTDTLAVDLENRPFREADGRLLFRPGGHGSLIRNLDRLDGDIVFIKNVDNVVPDRLKGETYRWKKVLGGYLLTLEQKIREFQRRLACCATDRGAVSAVEAFARKELSITLPDTLAGASPEKRGGFLAEQLDRPLRVCGMVPSSGEPGGGPFWVRDDKGGLSLQIVESAQIDPDSPEQQAILKGLTHFNPVDVVCSLRDGRGTPYDLDRFIDRNAIFISRKSKDGRDLKALEHPGLWNGGMAFWNTVFVEVPLVTFNPVKSVNDLLRDEHQG